MSFLRKGKNLTFEKFTTMKIQLINGFWTLNKKRYSELVNREKELFEAFFAFRQINENYNL